MKLFFYLTLLVLSGIPGMLSAQHVLQRDLNLPRAGEEIIKQQVKYKDPGRSGENVLWDFGQLQPVNDEYTLFYSEPVPVNDSIYILGMDTIPAGNLAGDKLLIGTEHNTMYYYYLGKNRIWVMGHENPATLLQYTEPLIAGIYPMQYKDSYRHGYQAKGLYSSIVPFTSNGEARMEADAHGMMILPSGDTLRNVLRTRTIQTIHQVFQMGDSTTVEQNSSIETFKWFSKGYRYPIFETIQTSVRADSTETVNFETAFFFPPQEHYYLNEDEDNLALLDSVRADGISPDIDPWDGLTYNFYPNPAETFLEIEIYMPKQGQVRMQLIDKVGRHVWGKDFGKWDKGIHSEQVFMSPFAKGDYVLNMWFDEYMVGEKILKK